MLEAWQLVVYGLAGGYIGGHVSVKKGDAFAVNVLLVLMLVAGVLLIAKAL